MAEVCVCCGKLSTYTIVLALGPQAAPAKHRRYYIPNDSVRKEIGTQFDVTEEVHFCPTCIRAVEDSMRATILYLQAESGLVTVSGDDYGAK
jgi:hypothetical protein